MTADADSPATSEPTRIPAVAPSVAVPAAGVHSDSAEGTTSSPGPAPIAPPPTPDSTPIAPAPTAAPIAPAPTAASIGPAPAADGTDGHPGPSWPGEPVPLAGGPLPVPVPPKPKRKSAGRLLIEWVIVLGTALAAALLVQAFFLKAFFIPSGSMQPSLEIDDRVLVNKLSYQFGPVQRGDIIVFKKPDNAPPSDVEDFIKRAVAVGGDVIEARDGIVYRNGERLGESYLAPGTMTTNLPRQTVPEGKVFVMGDNRSFSVDSRIFGPIDEGSIVGEALIRVWPPSKIGAV